MSFKNAYGIMEKIIVEAKTFALGFCWHFILQIDMALWEITSRIMQ